MLLKGLMNRITLTLGNHLEVRHSLKGFAGLHRLSPPASWSPSGPLRGPRLRGVSADPESDGYPINLVGNVHFYSQTIHLQSSSVGCVYNGVHGGVHSSRTALGCPPTVLCSSSSQRPGPAAGEVAAAHADVAAPAEGHRPSVWAQRLLQGPGRHSKLEGECGARLALSHRPGDGTRQFLGETLAH